MYKLKAYIKALRPIGWIPFWFSLSLGMIDGGFESLPKVATALVIFGPLLLGGIYMINFYSDIEADRKSSVTKDVRMADQPFASGEISPRAGLLTAVALITVAFVLAAFVNTPFLIASVYVGLILTIYSMPPRLKERPFADIFANSTTAGFASYAAGWFLFQTPNSIPIYPLIWVTLLVAATYLLTVIIDVEDDKRSRLTTTATVLGTKKALIISTVIYFASFLFYLVTLITRWSTLAYWILLPPLLKSPFSYFKLYKNPNRVYHLAKKAVMSAGIGLLVLIVFYTLLAIIGISDKDIINYFARLLQS